MLTISGAPTVSVVESEILPTVAAIVAVPIPELVARPFEPVVLLTMVTVASEVDQVTVPVMSLDVLSVYVPVAVNCCEWPSGTAGATGATAMLTKAAGVTFSVADPEIEPRSAVTVTVPTATVAASPAVLAALLTVAVPPSDELQCTTAVRSCVDPSVYVPAAVNCCAVPAESTRTLGRP